ncbi:MAG TPA: RagB/SusD family nutrient uptake outer membrane protein [Gemmatimonadaceae bacterium]
MKIVSKYPLLVGTTLLTLATGALYGCKDFLNNAATAQGVLDQSTLANAAGVEATLIGAYRTLDCTDGIIGDSWGCAASNWVFGDVASDDSYKGSNATDQPYMNDIEGYHWGTSLGDATVAMKWRQVYEGVVRSNSTLRLLKQVVGSSPGSFSTTTANSIAGEAIFLRAHYHFEAWRMWGNIPYYREDETDFRKANESSALAVADILKDLDSAIKLLPPTPRNGEKGRASQWTAKAYKGRVQVQSATTPAEFAAAVATLQDVKTNGPYALETSFDKVWTGFQAFANGKETIWAFQASANDGEPNGSNANIGDRLNFPYSGSHFGCCGFNQPSQNLVNFYQVDANGLPLSLSSPGTWNASDADFAGGPTNLTPVDPRLDYTVGRDGVPYRDWGLYLCDPSPALCIQQGWVRDPGNGGFYGPKKNVEEQASGAESKVGWQNTQLNSVNIHLYRYADLLLLLAEAQVETGDLAGAMANVNLVRARAGVTVQGCGKGADAATQAVLVAKYPACATDSRIAVPLGDPSVKWAVYKVSPYTSFPSQGYAREAVRTERRLELAMEGQRFFDLRRWGLAYAAAAINGYINGEGGGAEKSPARRLYLAGAETFVARHLLFPIPSLQVSLSTVGTQKMLTQNPGW